MENIAFSTLEKNILQSKGLSDEQMEKLNKSGIHSKTDFATVGDSQTLADLIGIPLEAATKIMAWALGEKNMASGGGSGLAPTIVVENPDAIYCAYCKAKQPKDYKSGDLCFSCGKQVEPVSVCHWCAIWLAWSNKSA